MALRHLNKKLHRFIIGIFALIVTPCVFTMDLSDEVNSIEDTTHLSSTLADFTETDLEEPFAQAKKREAEMVAMVAKRKKEQDCRKIQELLDSDRNVNENLIRIEGAINPLLLCAKKNYHWFIQQLIDRGAPVDGINERHIPLLIAAFKGNNDAISALILNNANLELVDNNEETALHIATRNGHAQTIALLLDKGALINALTGDKSTALIIAIENADDSIVFLLLARGAQIRQDALHQAVLKNRQKVVEALLNYGADINAQSNSNTPLHLACKHSFTSIVSNLLGKNADVHATNNSKDTPLHLAQRKPIIQKLICSGADPLRANGSNIRALDVIFHHLSTPVSRKPACITYFTERSHHLAQLNLSLEQCQKIFLIAFFFRDTAVIKKIIESLQETYSSELQTMLNYHSIDNEGNTVLIDAVKEKDRELIELLLKTNLMLCNRTNKNGFTAVDYAMLYNIDDLLLYISTKWGSVKQVLKHRYEVNVAKLTTHKKTLAICSAIQLTAEQNEKLEMIAKEIGDEMEIIKKIYSTSRFSLKNGECIFNLLKLIDSIPQLKNDSNINRFRKALHLDLGIISKLVEKKARTKTELIAVSAFLDYDAATRLLLNKVAHVNI